MKMLNKVEIMKRKLEKCYISWYVITCHVPLKANDIIEKKQVYLIYGVNTLGKRTIIDICLDNESDNRFWLEKLEYIKSRGVEKILYVSMNDNKNLARAFRIVYNSCIIIPAAVDVINSITKYFSNNYSSKITTELKSLFLSEDIKGYNVQLELFKERYENNKVVTLLLTKNIANIEKYYCYTKEIRKLLYPYYAIRDMKAYMHKLKNQHVGFAGIDEIIETMCEYASKFERASSYKKKEWMIVINQLYTKYKDEIEVFL